MSTLIQRMAKIIAVSALAFGLTACDKAAENPTAGQKLDKAIANTEKAADQAVADAKVVAAEASAAASNATEAARAAAADLKDAAKETGSAVASIVDGTAITAGVHAGLIKDEKLRGLQIHVATKDGVVSLSGEVPNQGAKDRAGEIAKAVPGVRSVQNELTLKAG